MSTDLNWDTPNHFPYNCEHDWTYISDWGGNPDIPNGTFDCSHYECTKCGEQQDDMPEGFEHDFPEPDYDDGPYIDRDCDYWNNA